MSGVCAVPEFWTTISEALTVIDGVFDATAAGGIVFHAAAGLDAPAVAAVQACVRPRLLRIFVRRGLLPDDDARAMVQWEHGWLFRGRLGAHRGR